MGKIKAYVRAGMLILAALVILVVLFMNRNHSVEFWFFGLTDVAKPTNVVWLIGGTAASTLTARRIVMFAVGFWRDLRAVRPAKDSAASTEKAADTSVDS